MTQFFMPKGHDLQSDFTKNRCHSHLNFLYFFKLSLRTEFECVVSFVFLYSIVMLLSDDLPDGSDGGKGELTNITHPFVTETYRCVDAFETKDVKNRPFKVVVDEKLDVLIKDPAGE